MALIEEAHKAAELLLDHAYVRIVARDDADATCAAALLGHALRRENVDFHFTAVSRLDAAAAQRLEQERAEGLVLVGLSGDEEDASLISGRRVVLDRHVSTIPAEAALHPGTLPDKSPDAPLSCFAYFVALALSKRNRDLAALAIAGAIARAQHVPAIRGLAADVLVQAEEAGTLLREPGLALHGPTLEQALAQLESPYVAGVTGRARNVKRLLQELHLPADAPPSSLEREGQERLGSFLALRLLDQHAPDHALAALYRPQVRALSGPHAGMDAATLARQAEAACAAGRSGLGVAALWPDASAGSDLLPLQAQWREGLVAALLKAERERRQEGPLVLIDAPEAGLADSLASRACMSLAPAEAVLVARHAQDGRVQLTLQSFGREDVGNAARKAAEAAGCRVLATRGTARAAPADESLFLKAFAEALG